METRTTVSIEDIRRHNIPEDCWIAIDEKVWDVTEFLSVHPGGPEGKAVSFHVLCPTWPC